ncbi:MAG: hypothetical protein ACRDNG_07550 [Gaiellaceae bacterium]
MSYHVQGIIEVFSTEQKAEQFIEEVWDDEPELTETLGIETIDLEEENLN